jgi:hypothetical protein
MMIKNQGIFKKNNDLLCINKNFIFLKILNSH